MNSLVSICIPMYNAANYVEETLQNLINQSYNNIEVIIVDDGSTDASVNIVKPFLNEVIKLYHNPNKGANAARNYAFSKSSGQFIKFMDADDFCSPKLIEKQVDLLQKQGTSLSLIFSPLKMLYSNGELIDPIRTIDKNYNPAIGLLIDIWNGGGFNCPLCHLIPKDLVQVSGGWDETILKNQDGEYFARVYKHADKALSLTDEYVVWRQTGTGVSSALSPAAINSVLVTYDKIINIILSHKDNSNTREICERYLGLFVYENYAHDKELEIKLNNILKKYNLSLKLPDRKLLNILRSFLGWKRSLKLIRKYNL
ncbi:hypothetical protein PK35_02360 [Tamlana nanhaiensis]|uniref:Glycosyltransferase 2-like domain-containing protein n=1 Tax=Neotamlana nanhaiensis TaxID=1382798 RepID=A0A0D7W801_9FLAO|nr:hypothetical protein PK35_02360 [Tamlana nanhaiensis]